MPPSSRWFKGLIWLALFFRGGSLRAAGRPVGARFFAFDRFARLRGGSSAAGSSGRGVPHRAVAFMSSSAADAAPSKTPAGAPPKQVHIAARDGSDDAAPKDGKKAKSKIVSFLQYDLPGSTDNATSLYGFGENKTYFLTFLRYMLGPAATTDDDDDDDMVRSADIQNRTVDASDPSVRKKLRSTWDEGRLLVMSNELFEVILGENSFHQRLDGFARRMKQYIERTDGAFMETLRTWLEEQWCAHAKEQQQEIQQREQQGEGTDAGALLASPFQQIACDPSRGDGETLQVLRELMRWFKDRYPYYYDSCLATGCGNTEGNSFLGYLAPNDAEKVHNTSRVELIHCSRCSGVSRFPRYNDAMKVLLDSRRGRCGEYSVAALALVESLGYTSRWVVDWADHVWIEVRVCISFLSVAPLSSSPVFVPRVLRAMQVLVGDRWVHVDPCEAAVDEPLLYESWGKNQTYILAFSRNGITDVTAKYTSNMTGASERRTNSPAELANSIRTAGRMLIDLQTLSV